MEKKAFVFVENSEFGVCVLSIIRFDEFQFTHKKQRKKKLLRRKQRTDDS